MTESRDYLKKMIISRASYADSGIDWGDAQEGSKKKKGKLEIDGAPMFISNMSPGVCAKRDSLWKQTYGASKDAYLCLLEGNTLMENKIESQSNFTTPYLEALPIADNSNLYENIGGRQQIQFIVGRDSPPRLFIDAARPMEDFESRSICLRAPMHISGWGRTITMRPTDPQPEDPNKRINDDEHKMDRGTWKTGPLDIRWDDNRKMWRAWNDLIADNEEKGIGTFVHSTNPDESEGFPFLRGRLEDVFWVRKIPGIDDELVTGVNDDGSKTGTLCLKMDSRILNPLTGQTGNLSDVFGITSCKTPVPKTKIGSEVTTEEFLAIRTHTHFAGNFSGVTGLDPGLVNLLDAASPTGPIKFIPTVPDSNIVTGAMYYDGAGHCDGTWVPGFDLDNESDLQVGGLLCKLSTGQFNTIFSNDISLGDAIKSSCELSMNTKSLLICALEYTQEWDDLLRANIRTTIHQAANAAITEALAGANSNIKKTMEQNNRSISDVLNTFKDQINEVLIRCFDDDSCFIPNQPPPIADVETFNDFMTKISVDEITPDLDYESGANEELTKLKDPDVVGKEFEDFTIEHACNILADKNFTCEHKIDIC